MLDKVDEIIKRLELDSKIPLFFQKDELSRQILKKGLESILNAEITDHLGYSKNERDLKKTKDKRNGAYERGFDTTAGRINNLKIPRDREGTFQSLLITVGQGRMEQIEELIIGMYSKGMGQREIAELLKEIYDFKLSAQTVSNIVKKINQECHDWLNRPLEENYAFLFIDALHQNIRRKTVAKEAIYVLVGVTLKGIREILGLYCLGNSESATSWLEIYQDIYERGVKNILLAIMDGLPGNEEAIKQVFPKTDVQECAIHHMRAQLNKVRPKDKREVAEAQSIVIQAVNIKDAQDKLDLFASQWESIYPSVIRSWKNKLYKLTTFMNYPLAIRKAIYTTNWIERMNKEFRKVLKNKNSFPTEDAVIKLMFLKAKDLDKKYSSKQIYGWQHSEYDILEMFKKRYPQTQLA